MKFFVIANHNEKMKIRLKNQNMKTNFISIPKRKQCKYIYNQNATH